MTSMNIHLISNSREPTLSSLEVDHVLRDIRKVRRSIGFDLPGGGHKNPPTWPSCQQLPDE